MVALVDIQVKKEYGPKYPVLMSDLVSVPGTYVCIASLFSGIVPQLLFLPSNDKP